MSAPRGPVTTAAPVSPAARRSLRLAWVAVALFPVSFVAAMVVGDWLLAVQGYESGSEVAPPLAVALKAGLPALLVLAVPSVPAVWLGLRARRLGHPNGFVPAIVGAVVGAASVALNLASLVLANLLG